LIDIIVHTRENMATLLLVEGHPIAKVSDPRYESLLANAAELQSQLAIAVFVLENIPDVDIDTNGMRKTLEDSGYVPAV